MAVGDRNRDGDMAAAFLVVLGFTLLAIESCWGAGGNISTSILEDGFSTRLACTLNASDAAVLGHRWMKGDRLLREDAAPGLTTEYEVDPAERPGQYSCTFLLEPAGRTARLTLNGPPQIEAVTPSEMGIEGERVVLVCKSRSFPPVSEWAWVKVSEAGEQLLTNKTQNKAVLSSETRTELHILNLDLKQDPGQYVCYGTNSEGRERAVITLRLRSRLTALWPFLGVVTEVVVLVTIILACEKCRKPDEVLGEEDAGSAPAKGSGHGLNDRDKRSAN